MTAARPGSLFLRASPLRSALIFFSLATAVRAFHGQPIAAIQPVPPSRGDIKRLIAERDFVDAERALTQLLREAPDDTELLTLQALTLFHEHRYVESRRIVEGLIAARNAKAEVRVLSGLLDVVANNLTAAETEFRAATIMDGANAAAHYYLGRTLYMRQAIDESIVEFRRTLDLDPNFIQAYDALGLAYVVKQDPDEATIWFVRGMKREQLRGGSKMVWLRLDLAAMMLTYNRGRDAEAYLLEARQIDAANPQVYLQLGQMYFQDARYGDALAAYSRVVALDPSNALAHYFRGRAFHLLKREQLAAAEFALFAALNRQHTMTQTPLAATQGGESPR